jgi:hypothetical protein
MCISSPELPFHSPHRVLEIVFEFIICTYNVSRAGLFFVSFEEDSCTFAEACWLWQLIACAV